MGKEIFRFNANFNYSDLVLKVEMQRLPIHIADCPSSTPFLAPSLGHPFVLAQRFNAL